MNMKLVCLLRGCIFFSSFIGDDMVLVQYCVFKSIISLVTVPRMCYFVAGFSLALSL